MVEQPDVWDRIHLFDAIVARRAQKFENQSHSCYGQDRCNGIKVFDLTTPSYRLARMAIEKKDGGTCLINEVSQRVGLSQKRIREYEKGGLIKPEREPRTNNRRYSEGDINQILRIKALIHEHSFTVACLRYFLAAAPCWIIFNCSRKETCPTYNAPHTPCYETAGTAAGQHRSNDCKSCPVYLNRNVKRMALLEQR